MASGANRSRGLGQGLSLLLRDQRPPDGDPAEAGLVELPVAQLRPNPRQPRSRLDPDAFDALVASIRRDGVVQPVIVRPAEGGGYELIAGERRWRAAQAAGLTRVPALVREADDRESLALALVENLVRSDLNPIEAARAYARLADEFKLSQTAIGEAVGRSRVAVANSLRLLELPDEALALVERGELSEGHGRAILQASDHDARRQLAVEAARRGLSVRETEAAARKLGRPTTRRRARRGSGPPWYDVDLAHDAVDAAYRAFGLPARVRPEGAGCRLEVTARSQDDLTHLVRRLEEAAEAAERAPRP